MDTAQKTSAPKGVLDLSGRNFKLHACKNAFDREHSCVHVWCVPCRAAQPDNARTGVQVEKGSCDHTKEGMSALVAGHDRLYFKGSYLANFRDYQRANMPTICAGCKKRIIVEKKMLGVVAA